jgi:DNA-binding MarR family transcriptional regulator
VVNLALTEYGQAVTQQIPAHLVQVLNQHLEGFSDAEFELFKNLLRRFSDNGNSSTEAL